MSYIQSAADIAIHAQSYFNEKGDVVMYLVISNTTLFGLFESIQAAADFVESQQVDGDMEKVGYIIPIYMDDESVWKNINKNYNFYDSEKKIISLLSIIDKGTNCSYRFGYIDLMMAYLMQHPEIIARHPELRKMMDTKINDAIKAIKKNNIFPKSVTMLYDYKRFVKVIKTRKDYIKDKHPYNLRSKNGF